MSKATRWQVEWVDGWRDCSPKDAVSHLWMWPVGVRLGPPTCSRCGREEGSELSRYGDVDPMGGVVGLTTCDGCGRVLCGECDAESECGCD